MYQPQPPPCRGGCETRNSNDSGDVLAPAQLHLVCCEIQNDLTTDSTPFPDSASFLTDLYYEVLRNRVFLENSYWLNPNSSLRASAFSAHSAVSFDFGFFVFPLYYGVL